MSEVQQIIESGGSSTGGTGQTTSITLDISKTPALNGTVYYDSDGNNKVKVTRMEDVNAGTNFEFYVHTLAAGGPFTLNATIMNADTSAGSIGNDIPNVYEVYYYKNTANNGALKVKTLSETKIFYSTTITTPGDNWTKYTGANDPTSDLGRLVNEIKDEAEIKVEKTIY